MTTLPKPYYQDFLPYEFCGDQDLVRGLTLSGRIDRAIKLIKEFEPKEGYSLRFSGGKDSVAVNRLLMRAGVKFEKVYNQTTIDPPELVRFIKERHPDAIWNRPSMAMMKRVATAPKVPPTRRGRWCCQEYKESGGKGRVLVLGTRAAESPKRKKNWREISEDIKGTPAVCPIVYWSDEQLWEFIHDDGIPYCCLYDEGFSRLGCIDCPLASKCNRQRERDRWPIFAENWRKAVISNWQTWHGILRNDGLPRYHALFLSGESFYEWWIQEREKPDLTREECQSGVVYTNEASEGEDSTDVPIKPQFEELSLL